MEKVEGQSRQVDRQTKEGKRKKERERDRKKERYRNKERDKVRERYKVREIEIEREREKSELMNPTSVQQRCCRDWRRIDKFYR